MNKNINVLPIEIYEHTDNGMSLRDYFAAQTINSLTMFDISRLNEKSKGKLWVAKIAYAIADAMLDERENYDY